MRYSTLGFLAFISACAGIFLFAYKTQLLIIRPWNRLIPEDHALAEQQTKRCVRFTLFKNQQPVHEQRTILWKENDDLHNVTHLIQAYCTLLVEEGYISLPIPIQVITSDLNQKMIICSLGASVFYPEQSTLTNWLVMEGLLKSIHDYAPRYQSFLLLINQKPCAEYQISSQQAWPLEGFREAWGTCVLAKHIPLPPKERYTILLDPAGDARTPGRSLGTSFERAETLFWAQRLKKELEQRCPHSTIYLTRTVGEVVDPIQKASFANRIKADLVIHLSLFLTTNTPEITCYTHRLHPASDTWKRTTSLESFLPYHYAHRHNAQLSTDCAHYLCGSLAKHPTSPLKPCGVYALPYKPLIGMMSPAFGIELGVQRADQWHESLEALVDALSTLLPACA